ncbi:MAG TPA: hypothetical protein VF981_07915 [Gemmatimonadaceae bacterium]
MRLAWVPIMRIHRRWAVQTVLQDSGGHAAALGSGRILSATFLGPPRLLSTVFLLGAIAHNAESQRVTGSASLSAEFYQQTGLPEARRPAQLLLAVGSMNFTLANGVTLPLSFYASTEGAGYQQPFNQFGASPTWGWATAHGGYFSTELSELTLQSARLLGGGLELQPGAFRAAMASGISQQTVRADSATGRLGVRQQSLSAFQIGLGRPGGALVWFTMLQAEDDNAGAIPGLPPTLTPTPQQNLVGSVRFALPIRDKVALEGEVAASGYSEDTNADELSDEDLGITVPTFVRSMMTPRSSSKFDGAGVASLRVTPSDQFNVALSGRYVGPGYRSLGAPQLEVDVRDITINPRLQTSRLALSASVGRRQNNVAGTRESTTSRAILDLSALVQATDQFSVSTQFTNYGMRAPSANDTLAIDNISRMASVTPLFQFQTGTWTHNLQVSLSLQDYTDRNILTGSLADNRTTGVAGTHTLILGNGLTLSTTASDIRGETGGESTVIQALSEALSMQFLRRRLGISASGTYTRTVTSQLDTGINGQLRASYRIDPRHHQLQFSTNYRRYDFGQPRGTSNGYTEMQTRLGYSLSF